MNWASRDILVEQCRKVQKNAVINQLNGTRGPYKTKELILAYHDHCPFFAYAMEDCIYAGKTQALNRLAEEGTLIKLHPGPGYYARYTFPKSDMIEIVDEAILYVINNNTAK